MTRLDIFKCPGCSAELSLEDVGAAGRCPSCARTFQRPQGVVDFLGGDDLSRERAYYDEYYAARRARGLRPPADLGALSRTWIGDDAPWEMQLVWRRLGDLDGKTVLLLGNGESRAELYMLTRNPGALIYSDLSPVGLGPMTSGLSEADNVLFAAMDALELPIRDDSVDVVYGFAFVHHLPEPERFLGEVTRVLRPGGRAVFMDNAYSPLWQRLKLGLLRPLMRLSHRREPRSPEDLRDTMAGGMREEVLAQQIRAAGGQPWFERAAFAYFFWKRASVSLFPKAFRFIPRHDVISRALMWSDTRLARHVPFVRANMVRLVWGLDKPLDQGSPAAGRGSLVGR